MRRTLALALVAVLALLVWLLRSEPERPHASRLAPAPDTGSKSASVSGAPREGLLRPANEPVSTVEEEPPSSTTPPLPFAVVPTPATPGAPCGRVVDARTGEPVPEVLVEVAWGAAKASDITDGNGWFEVETPATGSGACSIVLWDAGVALASLERDPSVEAPPWTLLVAIGPTYPLVLPGVPRGPDVARLLESMRDEDVAGVLAVLPTEITPAAEFAGEDRMWSWQAVRPGPMPWIRYPTMEHKPDDRLRKHIEAIESGGRFHRGTARSALGIQSEIVLRFVEARMNIAGRVVDEAGEPVASASVLLAPERSASEGAVRHSVWHEMRSGSDGSFTFDGVPRGRWNVFAWTAGEEQSLFARARLPDRAVVQDEVLLLRERSSDVVLEGVLPRGVLLRLEIRDCAPFGRGWLLWRGGATSGMASAASLWGVCWLGEPAWPSVSEQASEPPFPVQLERWALQVVDGPTGTPLDDAEILLGPRGVVLTRSAGAASWLFPAETELELEWMAARPGYASAFGDENAFTTADESRAARATLWPGWGAALYFRAGPRHENELVPESDRDSAVTSDVVGALAAPPIPGVEVQADGLECGTSDELGAVRLALDHAPLRLILLRRHWRLTGLDRLTVPGSCALRYVVWLEPDAR